MRTCLFLCLALLCLTRTLHAQTRLSQSVRGTVIDKTLQSPLPGTTVVILSTSPPLVAQTDEEGRFRFSSVPIGRHQILFRLMGYKELTLNQIEVVTGKENVLSIPLDEDLKQTAEVVVQGEKDKAKTTNDLAVVSAQNMRPGEINRFAGSRSDPSRMASNYAGVAGGGDQRNDIIVRGNSPWGVLWRLEGVDIPNPNHFTFTGNTGGAFSILNNNLLANSDFLTGAFPAEYGNKTAAVFDIRLRKGNNEKREHTAQIGLNGLEFVTEGPLAKAGGGSYLASGRLFSFRALDALGVSIGANGIPQYQDGTFKINLPTGKRGELTAWGIAGNSSIDLLDEGEALDQTFVLRRKQRFSSGMYAGGLSHSQNFGDKTRGVFSLSASGSSSRIDNEEDWVEKPKLKAYDLKNREGQVIAQYILDHKWNVRNRIRVGASYRMLHFSNKEMYFSREDDRSYQGLNQTGNAGLAQVYGQYQWRLNEKFSLNPGVYVQHFGLNNQVSVEPRVSAQYQASDRDNFRIATGLHSQTAPLFLYQYQFFRPEKNAYDQPNRHIGFSKSWQAVLGYQRQLNPNLLFKAEAYYQYLFNVPVSLSSDTGASIYSMLNTGASYGFWVPDSLRNTGTGENYGIEMTLERFYSKGYYFLSTVSLFRSFYTDGKGVRRSTLFDIGHVWNALAGKEFALDKSGKRLLSLDLKITHSGGRGYIPVDTAASLRDNKARYDYNRAFESRLKPYFRTDLKIAYHVNRPKANHQFFIAADNVLNTQNEFWKDWNNKKRKVETYYQLGVFPYLGYRVQF